MEQRFECAQVDHAAVDVEALEAGRRRAAQDQVVGAAVFDDDRPRGRGPGEDADPSRERHRRACRDVDGRRDDRDRRLVGQVVGFEAVRVDASGDQPGARQPDRPGHHRVARILDDRPPVRPQPEPRRDPDPDDRAGQDHDLGGLAVGPAHRPQASGDRRPEEGIACWVRRRPAAARFGERPPLLAEQALEARADAQRAVRSADGARPAGPKVVARHRLERAPAVGGHRDRRQRPETRQADAPDPDRRAPGLRDRRRRRGRGVVGARRMRRDDRPEAHPPDEIALSRQLLVRGGDGQPPDAELSREGANARDPLAGTQPPRVDRRADERLDLTVQGFGALPIELHGQGGRHRRRVICPEGPPRFSP